MNGQITLNDFLSFSKTSMERAEEEYLLRAYIHRVIRE